jgi:hypothetical protein
MTDELTKKGELMMAKMTVVIGVLLAVLGAGSYLWTGSQHPTALIPLWFGLVLCLCGVLANTENSKRRMLWMHVAVTVGLIGFLGAASRIVIACIGTKALDAIAVGSQATMSLLCAIFVGLCVRSFIAARRSRSAAA